MSADAGVVPEVAGYVDLVPLGRGGVADVYRARQAATGRAVAIKVLRDVADASSAWRRCRRELTALLALGGHPHVVALVDVVAGESPALVVELVEGGSLAEAVERRGGSLSVGEAIRVGSQVASALAAAHARGIVHRDVKPHNVLITADGDVKLCDFGIASLLRSPELRHATAAVSLRFASPEDLEGDGEVGPASDIYSFGATLLQLAHGQQLDLRARLGPWAPPDGGGDALDAVIAACLRPEPDARPTAAEVSERLVVLDGELGVALQLGAESPAPSLRELPSVTLHRPFPGHRPAEHGAPPRRVGSCAAGRWRSAW